MYQDVYYIDKRTGTLADVLAAWGLAAILDILLEYGLGEPGEVVLRDSGSCYMVTLSYPVEEAWLSKYFDLLPFIETEKSKGKPRGMHPVVDYQAEQQRNDTYFEMRKRLPKELRRPDAPHDHPAIQAMNQYKPHPHWPIWAAINQMGALTTYNKLAAWWYENRSHTDEILKLILWTCATYPNRIAEAEGKWKELVKAKGLKGEDRVTAVQFFNPAAGKGINQPKPSGPRVGPLKSFWLLELLKAVGMYEAGLPLRVQVPQREGEPPPRDRKTYVLMPLEMELREHDAVFSQFRAALYGSTTIKMDILASLRYTRTFLRHCEANRGGSLAARLFGHGPQHFVAGLAVAFYKDLKGNVVILNQSQINLPGWIKVETPKEVKDYLKVLEEHERVVRALDENQGDGYTLLSLYRDFISARDLEPFYEFAGLYAGYLISRMERRQWAPQFTTINLRRVIMGTERKLKPILDNTGFQNVAYAIRRSTVVPQYRKMRDKSNIYDVRYGLGAELKRKANYDEDFIQTLANFMHSYNQETVQVAERLTARYGAEFPEGIRRRLRRRLSTEDINQVVALVDEYGAKTVGNLLVAYGYAREPWEPEVEAEEEVEEVPVE
jgi:hypothetical protein